MEHIVPLQKFIQGNATAYAGKGQFVIEPVDLTAVDVASIHPSLTREACMKAWIRSGGCCPSESMVSACVNP